MEKLVIAASAKFQEGIDKWEKYFTDRGYNVINRPRKIDQSIKEVYRNAHLNFYKSLKEADVVFILNEDKRGIEGYIGYETFAELSFAMVQNTVNGTNKKVYLLKMPSEEVGCYPEIKNFVDLGWIKVLDQEKDI